MYIIWKLMSFTAVQIVSGRIEISVAELWRIYCPRKQQELGKCCEVFNIITKDA
jgi:hypothetical protein